MNDQQRRDPQPHQSPGENVKRELPGMGQPHKQQADEPRHQEQQKSKTERAGEHGGSAKNDRKP